MQVICTHRVTRETDCMLNGGRLANKPATRPVEVLLKWLILVQTYYVRSCEREGKKAA